MNQREYRQMYEVEDWHWWYVSLHELIAAFVAAEQREGTALQILDAGCGTGRLCQILLKYGNVSGCDISPEALACCRERSVNEVFRADLNTLELPAANYDIITSIDTLYHQAIVDDAAIIARFFDALKPGGILVLNLVAHEFLRSSHDIAVQTRKRYIRGEVVAMLDKAGFRVELATYRLGLLFPPIAIYRLLRRLLTAGRSPEEVRSDVTRLPGTVNGLLLRLARWENRIIPRCPIPLGTSVFVVARRPV